MVESSFTIKASQSVTEVNPKPEPTEKKAYPIVMASDVYLPHHGMPKENES